MPDLTESDGNYATKGPDNNVTNNTSLGHPDAIPNHPQTGTTTSLPSCETTSPSLPRLTLKNLDDIRIQEEPNDVTVVTVKQNIDFGPPPIRVARKSHQQDQVTAAEFLDFKQESNDDNFHIMPQDLANNTSLTPDNSAPQPPTLSTQQPPQTRM